MEKKNRIFKSIASFLENSHTVNEETYAEELSNFATLDKQNIKAVEFIAYWAYPSSRFKKFNMKNNLEAFGQMYYPIAGWDPDVALEAEESAIRKQLKRIKKRVLHNPRENKTYILYG